VNSRFGRNRLIEGRWPRSEPLLAPKNCARRHSIRLFPTKIQGQGKG
jgi:hypothetical protein